MPCNIGYQEAFRAELRVPQAKRFESRASGPRIDRELLERIGVEDPEFLDWLRELDVAPLLQAALGRTRLEVNTRGLDLAIDNAGMLAIGGDYKDAAGKAELARRGAEVSERWQLEVLSVVGELLGYETRIGPGSVLVAEKQGDGSVGEHFNVTIEGDIARMRFEHFKTRDALRAEVRKVLALARKCGLAVALYGDEPGGAALPEGQALSPGREGQA